MTTTIALVKRRDHEPDTSTLSLTGYTDGIEVKDWPQAIANGQDEAVTETMTLIVRGTTNDNLAQKVQVLDDYLIQAGRYNENMFEDVGIWLRAKMTSESGSRQAFILDAQRGPTPVLSYAAQDRNYITEYPLTLRRAAHWEAMYAGGLGASYTTSASGINATGGQWPFVTSGASNIGDQPARLADVTITAGSGNGTLTEMWVGFKSGRLSSNGFSGSADCVWGLYLGDLYDDSTSAADGTAKVANRVRCTFATSTCLVSRAEVDMVEVSVGANDIRGRHTILLRAKCGDSSTTARVRLSVGAKGGIWKAQPSRVSINGTSWDIYHVGVVENPDIFRLARTSFALRIEAERTAGTSYLDVDCLILIPSDEGFIHLEDLVLPASQTVDIVIRPEGEYGAYQGNAIIPTAQVIGGFPIHADASNSYAIVCGKRQQSSVLTDEVKITVDVYPRWTTLRGTE